MKNYVWIPNDALFSLQYGAGNSSAEMRWHQTADYGVVSNPQQEDVFMAVTMDLRNATSDAANLL